MINDHKQTKRTRTQNHWKTERKGQSEREIEEREKDRERHRK